MATKRSSKVFKATRRKIFAFYRDEKNHSLIMQSNGPGDPRPFWDTMFVAITGHLPSTTHDTATVLWPGMNDPTWDELIDGEQGMLEANHRILRILQRLQKTVRATETC